MVFTYFTNPSQPGQLDYKWGLPVFSVLPLLPVVSLPHAVSVSHLLVAVGAPPVASFPAAPFPPPPSSACTGWQASYYCDNAPESVQPQVALTDRTENSPRPQTVALVAFQWKWPDPVEGIPCLQVCTDEWSPNPEQRCTRGKGYQQRTKLSLHIRLDPEVPHMGLLTSMWRTDFKMHNTESWFLYSLQKICFASIHAVFSAQKIYRPGQWWG